METEHCEHKHVTIYFRFWAGTRYEPPEYDWRNKCRDCGEWIDDGEVPEGAELEEIEVDRQSLSNF